MNKKYIIVLLNLIILQTCTFAQPDSLRNKIASIAALAKAKVGVAVINLQNGDTLTLNGNERMPMQSVFKFPLGLYVFNQIDKGKLKLEQKIHIPKNDLLPDTYSPLRDKYPDGNIDIALDDLLRYTVSLSDNNGCDILFRLMEGTSKVEKYIHSIGINDISIAATEEEMHKEWDIQYRNYSTPLAMAKLFKEFYSGNILSHVSTKHLLNYLIETPTGPKRIKSLLPEGTIVAHKTGSSGANDKGISAATNDAGIIQLQNGGHLVLVVFVSDSASDNDANEDVIAKIAKTVWDYYSKQQK